MATLSRMVEHQSGEGAKTKYSWTLNASYDLPDGATLSVRDFNVAPFGNRAPLLGELIEFLARHLVDKPASNSQ